MTESSARGVGIDDLDLRIIAELEIDGRRPVIEIARAIGVPNSTVQRRLEALIRNRVIMVAPYADSAKLGLPIHVHFNLHVDLNSYQETLEAVVALSEVRWVAVTTGPADIVAEGFFASPEHLHQFIKETLAPIHGITKVETAVILNVAKFTFHWAEIRRKADQRVPPHIRLSTPATAYKPRSSDLAEPDGSRRRRPRSSPRRTATAHENG
ncbi:MAG TPA: Lrp/AsnC family transcriptional regulator [Thermomicrobiales bacterium]|jgi:DNA-binding Lrp family transcriptional regulator